MSIPARDAEVAEVAEVVEVEVEDVSCRGKIAASDDCAIKATKRKTNLRGGCIEKIQDTE
jgi:hypothetical protein